MQRNLWKDQQESSEILLRGLPALLELPSVLRMAKVIGFETTEILSDRIPDRGQVQAREAKLRGMFLRVLYLPILIICIGFTILGTGGKTRKNIYDLKEAEFQSQLGTCNLPLASIFQP